MSRMPQVTARELVRFLKSQGFVEDRQSGSHLTLWHEARGVSVTVRSTLVVTLDAGWRCVF
jgi:predicted RNA binding protein YcfA (HicA-like mRNA interferase family)